VGLSDMATHALHHVTDKIMHTKNNDAAFAQETERGFSACIDWTESRRVSTLFPAARAPPVARKPETFCFTPRRSFRTKRHLHRKRRRVLTPYLTCSTRRAGRPEIRSSGGVGSRPAGSDARTRLSCRPSCARRSTKPAGPPVLVVEGCRCWVG